MSLALAWAGAGLALGWAGLALGWAGTGLGSRWDWVATGPRTHSPVAQWLLRGSLPRSMSPNDTTHQICPSPKELAIIYQRAPRVLASICLQNRPTEPIVQIPSRDSSPACAEQLPQRACNHLPRRTPKNSLPAFTGKLFSESRTCSNEQAIRNLSTRTAPKHFFLLCPCGGGV